MKCAVSPKKARVYLKLAKVNDTAHSFVLFFLLFGHLFVGILWHVLFIVIVVRLQLAFRGCPMTILSDHLRSYSEKGEYVRVFRHGTTAWLYQKFGKWALLLIAGGWFLVIFLQRWLLNLLI